MKNKAIILALISVFLIIGFLLFKGFFFSSTKSQNQKKKTPIDTYHEIELSEESQIWAGISQPKSTNRHFPFRIAGGIIPHHLLASQIIADFFQRLFSQKPEVIILFGPNHYEKGDFKVLSSLYAWKTSFGTVKPNTEIANALIKKGLIRVDEEVLVNEHAITGILPFIAHYLPETTVVPMVFSGNTTQEEVEKLVEELVKIVNENTLVLASVDFSHYLKAEDARQNDIKTIKIIRNFDYLKLFGLGNDYLDSPPAMALLLKTMSKMGKTNQELLYHTNSAELANDPFVETTSYVSMIFF